MPPEHTVPSAWNAPPPHSLPGELRSLLQLRLSITSPGGPSRAASRGGLSPALKVFLPVHVSSFLGTVCDPTVTNVPIQSMLSPAPQAPGGQRPWPHRLNILYAPTQQCPGHSRQLRTICGRTEGWREEGIICVAVEVHIPVGIQSLGHGPHDKAASEGGLETYALGGRGERSGGEQAWQPS